MKRIMSENGMIKGMFQRVLRKLLLTRPAVTISVALILGPAGFLFYQCYYSPDVPFILNHSNAAWIRYPEPVSTYTRRYTDIAYFSKGFSLDQDPRGKVIVHMKAFRNAQLYINEIPVFPESRREENWKKEIQIEVSQFINPGENSIRVEVQNPMGPALLWLRMEGLKKPIATDETWKTRIKTGPYIQAILADDTKTYAESQTVPTAYQSFSKKGTSILLIFLASIGLWGVGRLFFQGKRMKILPWAALGGILMVWIYLFLAKMLKLDPYTGFDMTNHLEYITYISRNKDIPLPTEGWSMFHPPFFYLLSAGLLQISKLFSPFASPFQVLKIIPFLCGVGNIWVAYTFGRMIFSDNPIRIFFVVLIAGVLPMNIYMSAYVGNEPLHALLASLSLLRLIDIFRSPEISYSKMIYLGIFLGLASLTKITAWVFVPVVAIFLMFKMICIDRKMIKEAALRIGSLLLIIVAISGWYYIRNIIYFGRPFMINWNLPGQQWWQDPGFHMIQYFFGFGETLRHPYFSCFHSFWDSIYSTFWGDGMVGGKVFLKGRPAVWNYDYMSTIYLLALPTVGIFLIGLCSAIQIALTGKERDSKLIMGFLILCVYSITFFILFSTVRVPIYSQAKAFYSLSAVGPISVVFALGLAAIHNWLSSRHLLVGRAVFYGWFGTLISVIYLSFGG